MGVVFAVLSILAISIKLFDRLDSLVPASGAPESATIAPPAPARGPAADVEQPDSVDDDAQTAAAIAVALALADEGQRTSPTAHPSAPAQTPGSGWLTTGRYREMSKRMSAPPAKGRRDR